MTLARAAFGQQTLIKQVLLVIGGTLLIALAAKVTVPMYPVPMTLQTLAILAVGFAYGARLGAITLVAYLAEGLAGLTVFSATTPAGPAAFVGPTAGFLIGFVGMAWAAGWVAGFAFADFDLLLSPLSAAALAAAAAASRAC